MSQIPKGVIVRIKEDKTHDHGFKAGSLVESMGEDFGEHHRGLWSKFKSEFGSSQYLLPEHYEMVKDAAPTEIEVKLVDGEEQRPSKVIYAVVKGQNEVYTTTFDRAKARDIKAALGGKSKGVRIFQYAAVKEIR
jgi:hypothetical protein